ncbi:MAG: M48 family metalloprotease [Kiritimatiellia bacterium]
MNRPGKIVLSAAVCVLAFALAGMLSGCASVIQAATVAGEAAGVLTSQQAGSINRSAQAVEKSFTDITPEQEYYIGRSVAATILGTYEPLDKEAATEYLNLLGQTLAMASDRPETFRGYHFMLLDTDEINAFSAPGGLVLISRGMIRCCKTEDELAAVLAHEIGHVQHQHGLRAIKKSRLTSALTILAAESAKNFGDDNLARLTEAFEGSIGDVVQTLRNSGYARALEREADASAVTIMKRVGYDPNALVTMLQHMKQNLKPGGLDFAKTHPDPEDRIDDVKKLIGAASAPAVVTARQQRFAQAMDKF